MDINYDDRLNRLEEQAFDQAVIKATARVSQDLAQIHRRRLVTQTAAIVATIVATSAIALIFYFKSQTADTYRHNSVINCQLITQLSGVMGDFVSSDARLRNEQNHLQVASDVSKALNKIFSKSLLAKAEAESQAASVNTTNHWYHYDVPQLKKIAQSNCVAQLK